jgi:hypothetical protein
MPSNRSESDSPLLSARTALILLFSVLAATAVTGLLVADGRSLAAAGVVGIGVLAAATKFFHWLIS